MLAIASLSLHALDAQDFSRIAPKQPPQAGAGPKSGPNSVELVDTHILIPAVQALVFETPERKLTIPSHQHGIVAPDLPLLQSRRAIAKLAPFLARPLSMQTLQQIQREVAAIYRAADFPVVTVSLPEQEITGGVVRFVVTEARVGRILVEGARWSSDKHLTATVRLRPEDRIRESILESDIAWLNRNPFRDVSLVYTPGPNFGTTDVILSVKDRFPVRVYTGYDNSGVRLTQRDRLFAGFNIGTALLTDGLLGYQFTTSPDGRSSISHAFTGQWFLPWRHSLDLFGGWTHSQALFGPFRLRGESWQAGVHYTIPLIRTDSIAHALSIGADWKKMDNPLEFNRIQISGQPVQIAQLSAGYNVTAQDRAGSTAFHDDIFFSPGGIDAENEDRAFDTVRHFAKSRYVYTRAELDRVTRLPANFSLVSRVVGQLSNTNLLPSEQIGLGGAESVRGFDERTLSGDQGFLISNELRSPDRPILQHLVSRIPDRLQLLAFVEGGTVRNKLLLPDEPPRHALWGAGIGLRYTIDPWLSFRADYGWPLVRPAEATSSGRAHLSLTISY